MNDIRPISPVLPIIRRDRERDDSQQEQDGPESNQFATEPAESNASSVGPSPATTGELGQHVDELA